ncbi:hypothetical protein [Gordonia rhizosphera]|uniref:Uncharacterized protein n=1 Tax=Gordonia rhizosphera NBRC 16068 TaxID=1108045 RepID=K6VY80_9ACTN|nr:hypothetical protein [Gordonia rhizosphera]GAB91845.1 hypothetical protein GORHZ_151_00170 [Gordonia rhizosphera NBRC 16068]
MGQPDGGPARPLDDLYRTPLYPQLYPPLGYAPDGTPIFVPGQQGAPPSPPLEPIADSGSGDSAGADEAPPAAPGRGDRSDRRLIGVLSLVAIAAIGLLALTVGRAALRTDEPAAAPTLPVFITPTEPPTVAPGVPGLPGDATEALPGDPGAPVAPIGKQVVYEVTSAGGATILYVDAAGLRTTIGAPSPWTLSFTGSANPLRVLVLAGPGAASCVIKVDGRIVAADRISADSTRRTVSCRA